MGALGSLNFFSLEKFIEDCKKERVARKIWIKTRHDFIVPLYVPEDKHVVRGIREIAEKGGPKNADHTLSNVDAFINWRKRLIELADNREYYPELLDTIRKERDQLNRASHEQRASQLQDTFFI
jgi:trimethylamine--corrinoid protein Co-methyltransferase